MCIRDRLTADEVLGMESGLTADEVLGLVSGLPTDEVLGLDESLEMRTNAVLGSPEPTVNVVLPSPENTGSARGGHVAEAEGLGTSVVVAATKSASVNTSQLIGTMPHLRNPFMAMVGVAALKKASPRRRDT